MKKKMNERLNTIFNRKKILTKNTMNFFRKEVNNLFSFTKHIQRVKLLLVLACEMNRKLQICQ